MGAEFLEFFAELAKQPPLVISLVVNVFLVSTIYFMVKRLFKYSKAEGVYEAELMFNYSDNGLTAEQARERINNLREDALNKRINSDK